MVRSIERSIDVLNLLVPPGRAMTLSQLSRELGAPKSTVLTIVRTLAGRILTHAGRLVLRSSEEAESVVGLVAARTRLAGLRPRIASG